MLLKFDWKISYFRHQQTEVERSRFKSDRKKRAGNVDRSLAKQAKQKTTNSGWFQSGLGTKSPTLTSKEEETQAGLRPAFVI